MKANVMRKIEAYQGDLLILKDFKEAVARGAFIDDGFGYPATDDECDPDIEIIPAKIDDTFDLPSWATHVLWFNK